jgi:hypothetical protein
MCFLVTMLLTICSLEKLANAEVLPNGFTFDRLNGSVKPATVDGVTTFQIFDKQCSKKDYGDGRGESDCHNGNVRSSIAAKMDAKTSSTLEYKFDIWIDPVFAYRGWYNDHSNGFLPDGHDSRLRIASWEGEFLHNFIYMLKADTQAGIFFLDKQCQSPKDFGKWVTFSLKVRWAGSEKGWLEVSCDNKLIYSKKDLATNQNPHCYITNQCEKDKKKNPRTIHFIVGPTMAGFGFEWSKYGLPSQFTDIQQGGITMKVKNLTVSKIKDKVAR